MKTIFGLAKTLHLFSTLFSYIMRSHRPGADFRQLKAGFTDELLKTFNFEVKIEGDHQPSSQPAIYVCNHISYMDIPLILNLLPHVSFVSKQEVAQWPIIGTAATRIDTIFVKRESKDSRTQTRKSLHQALIHERKNIVIFPSGTTRMEKSDSWRKGIFEIAQENNVPIIPIRLQYQPLRALAYIDDDTLFTHMINLASLKKIDATLEMGTQFYVSDSMEDCHRTKQWCEQHMTDKNIISEMTDVRAFEAVTN